MDNTISFFWLFFRLTTVNFELKLLDDAEVDQGDDNVGKRAPKNPELDALSIPLIL